MDVVSALLYGEIEFLLEFNVLPARHGLHSAFSCAVNHPRSRFLVDYQLAFVVVSNG